MPANNNKKTALKNCGMLRSVGNGHGPYFWLRVCGVYGLLGGRKLYPSPKACSYSYCSPRSDAALETALLTTEENGYDLRKRIRPRTEVYGFNIVRLSADEYETFSFFTRTDTVTLPYDSATFERGLVLSCQVSWAEQTLEFGRLTLAILRRLVPDDGTDPWELGYGWRGVWFVGARAVAVHIDTFHAREKST